MLISVGLRIDCLVRKCMLLFGLIVFIAVFRNLVDLGLILCDFVVVLACCGFWCIGLVCFVLDFCCL